MSSSPNTINRRAFTLIELLVVIAIIGVLSAIVAASFTNAKINTANAAVKSNLATLRNQAAIYFNENNGNYGITTNSCSAGIFVVDSRVTEALTAASNNGAGGASCNATPSAWAVSVPFKNSGYWCVDSIGNAKSIVSALGSGVAFCP